MAMGISSRLVFIIVVLVASSCTTDAKKKITNIQFYMHDIVSGPNATAVKVAGRPPESTNSNMIASLFGSIYVIDDPLTATPQMNSTLLGRAQGIYAMASQQDEFSLLMTLTYEFVAGPHNGSSFSIVGRNPVMKEVREMPVVGGTGTFRLARGYCLARTYSINGTGTFRLARGYCLARTYSINGCSDRIQCHLDTLVTLRSFDLICCHFCFFHP